MRNWILLGLSAFALIFVVLYVSRPASTPAPKTPLEQSQPVSEAELRARISETVEIREIETDEAQMALDKFRLWVPEGTTDWDKRTGRNGNYVFENLRFELEGQAYVVAEMEIKGVRLLEGERPYFDTIQMEGVTFTVDADNGTDSTDSFILKMPDPIEMSPAFKAVKVSAIRSPFDYLVFAIESGSDEAGIYPEFIIENYKTNSTDEVQDYSTVREETDGFFSSQSAEKKKEVENRTSIGFAGLSRIKGQDSYIVQINNFDMVSHSFMGNKETVRFASLNINDVKPDSPQKLSDLMNPAFFLPMVETDFDPQFMSASIQGVVMNFGFEELRVDSARVWHSDLHSDFYSHTVEIPRVELVLKPIPDHYPEWRSDDPFRKNGLDSGSFSYNGRVNFDKTTRSIEAEQSRYVMDGGFDLQMRYGLNHWDELAFLSLTTGGPLRRSVFGQEALTAEEKIQPSLSKVNISFRDLGLMDKLISNMVGDEEMSKEGARTLAKGYFSTMENEYMIAAQTDILTQASTAWSAFLEQGGSLELSIQPSRNISITELSNALWSHKQQARAAEFKERAETLDPELRRQMETMGEEAFLFSPNEKDAQAEAEERRKLEDAIRAMNVSIVHIP